MRYVFTKNYFCFLVDRKAHYSQLGDRGRRVAQPVQHGALRLLQAHRLRLQREALPVHHRKRQHHPLDLVLRLDEAVPEMVPLTLRSARVRHGQDRHQRAPAAVPAALATLGQARSLRPATTESRLWANPLLLLHWLSHHDVSLEMSLSSEDK